MRGQGKQNKKLARFERFFFCFQAIVFDWKWLKKTRGQIKHEKGLSFI
jgi:hypothetical protein